MFLYVYVCVYLCMLKTKVSSRAQIQGVQVCSVFMCFCVSASRRLSPLAPCGKKNEQFVSPHHFTNEISAVRRWINIIRKARVGH